MVRHQFRPSADLMIAMTFGTITYKYILKEACAFVLGKVYIDNVYFKFENEKNGGITDVNNIPL